MSDQAASFNALDLVQKARSFYLGALRSDDLKEKFGGPVFIFLILVAAIKLIAAWHVDNNDLFVFAQAVAAAPHEDFAAFYRGGEMAMQGQAASVYDLMLFIEGLTGLNITLLFLNPPQSLLFYEPLAHLSYPVARGLFLFLCVGCLLLSIRMTRLKASFWPYFFVIFSGGTFYSFQLLQLAPVTAFLLLFALLYSREKPILSGLALAILTIKPQYGFLAPVFLIACRDWKAFLVAALGTLTLVGASIGLYGVSTWQAFLQSLSGGVHAAQFEVTHGIMTTISQSFGKIGAGKDIRLAAQAVTVIAMAAIIWHAARHRCREEAVALSMFAMCIAAPSFFYYDWVNYSLALLLALAVCPKWSLPLQIAAGLLWITPALHGVIAGYDKPAALQFSMLVPAIAIITLGLLWHAFEKKTATGSKTMTPEIA